MSAETEHFVLARFDAEMALLRVGLKTVIKMEFADPRRLKTARDLGFTCVTADGRYSVSQASADLDYQTGDAQTVFVGREQDIRRALRVEETEHRATGTERLEAMREMGALLGYPSCCTEAYSQQEDQAETASFSRLLGGADELTGSWGNNLFVLEHQLISHFPCHLGCGESEKMAEAAFEVCKETVPNHVRSLETLLRAPITVWDRFRFVIDHPLGTFSARHISTIGRAVTHPSFQAFDAALPALPTGGTHITWT